jgi:hypothetical protein
MKALLLVILTNFVSAICMGQSIGIGTKTPHPSAILDLTDTTKGILIPRLTNAQRKNISNPSQGLLIFQTDSTRGYWFYDGLLWSPLITNVQSDSRRIQTQIYLKN